MRLEKRLESGWELAVVAKELLRRLLLPAMALAAAIVLLLCLALRRAPLEAGLLGALAAAWLGFSNPPGGPYYLAAGGLILVLALVEDAFALAFEDTLTGLPARRAFDEALARLGSGYALAMVDLDHFKKVNDRHGHEVGDQILRMVARRLASAGRGSRAFRYGGEEFALIFAGRTTRDVLPVLEELRESISEQSFTIRAPDRPRQEAEAHRQHRRGGTQFAPPDAAAGAQGRRPGALSRQEEGAQPRLLPQVIAWWKRLS